MDEVAFNALLRQRSSSQHGRSDRRLGADGRRARPRLGLFKLAAAGAAVFAVAVGLAGYYLVWPLLSHGLSGNIAQKGREAVTKQIEAAGVPKDITTWAKETAKKEIERTAREKLGLPAGKTPANGEAAAEGGKAEGSEAD
ncbi:hypothetical protein GCM10008942_02880 [Rhizomicrobium electricum]|uniref:Uncharacterized protein n=2 Tax=Rhizomicrobium electricum TaxID=480070 RepID=A0ABP3P7C7_9PROT